MRDLVGAAFITGGASGIGLGMAQAFARAGVKVALADVREKELRKAVDALTQQGATCLAVPFDVTDRKAWAAAAERVERELGPVRILCSNAGVNFVGPVHEATYEDWEFTLNVNLGGAINAVKTFTPRMIARGGEHHIVLTSSVVGLFTHPGASVYATTKFALLGFAETLRMDLAKHNIGVSALCPGPVKSDLFESTLATRPEKLASTGSIPIVQPGVSREDTPIFVTALTGQDVGRCVLRGIRRNDMYILTHPEIRGMLQARANALLAALPADPIDPRRVEASRPLLDASFYEEFASRPAPSGEV